VALAADDQAWLDHDEELWRRAQVIARRHPGIDVSGIHHVLRNLERSPEERLARGLRHAKLRPGAR
jgi:hypothetical protein